MKKAYNLRGQVSFLSVEMIIYNNNNNNNNNNSVALVGERTIPTERPPHVGKVSANFC
jgi:hypothetical protein